MYEKILYDGQNHTSIATLPGMAERTLIFNGLSKAYAMTGWRLGYVAGPKPFMQQIEKVHSHSVTCATSFVQTAGVVALNGPQEFIGEMVAAWDRRRRNRGRGPERDQRHRLPAGRGRVLRLRRHPRNRHVAQLEAADLFLQEAHVAVVPGVAFGEAGEGHVRLSFATERRTARASRGWIGISVRFVGAQTGA